MPANKLCTGWANKLPAIKKGLAILLITSAVLMVFGGKIQLSKYRNLRNNSPDDGISFNGSVPGLVEEFPVTKKFVRHVTIQVNYVRFYETDPEAPGNTNYQLCYLECLAILSVMVNVRPVNISIHSNHPHYIPFESCQNLTGTWSDITMVYRERHAAVGGKKISYIHHAADLAKLEVLYEYGGIVLDFDVYLLRGRRIRSLLKRYDCVISQEFPTVMNAGFSACRKGSSWPKDLLAEYRRDFQPVDWLYNSGTVPFRLFSGSHEYRKTIYVDQTISNNPNGKAKYLMQVKNNAVDWKAKLGYHTFIDDCNFNLAALNASKSSLGYLLRSIVKKSLQSLL